MIVQALYATRKKLSCTQWHCYAAEHMLPSAFILSHPGMGATVHTFLRHGPKGPEKHPTYAETLNIGENEPWKVGQVCAPPFSPPKFPSSVSTYHNHVGSI